MDYSQKRQLLPTLRFKLGLADGEEITYPLTAIPRAGSKMFSPQVGKSHGLPDFDFKMYEEYLWEVREVRDMVSRGEYPLEFLQKHYPRQWGQLPLELPQFLQNEGLTHEDPQDLCNVVHMDAPIDLGLAFMRWLYSRKKKDRFKGLKDSQHVDFLERGPSIIAGLSKAVEDALYEAFEAKYYFGVARPEEVYEYLTGCSGKGITEYKDMSYNHCSYPAGHGSAAGRTGKYFQETFNLDAEEQTALRQGAYLWSQWRTFAGVHYAVDNLQGLLGIGGIK